MATTSKLSNPSTVVCPLHLSRLDHPLFCLKSSLLSIPKMGPPPNLLLLTCPCDKTHLPDVGGLIRRQGGLEQPPPLISIHGKQERWIYFFFFFFLRVHTVLFLNIFFIN
ncbi:hypothetical protein ACOSP7_029167 [Xanthoceras sorbifolium]